MRTAAQRLGDDAEARAERHLLDAGWTILGRHVRVGRLELDLVAVDPGPPARLVGVEVRWRAARSHGLAEETIDRRKQLRLRVAISELAATRSPRRWHVSPAPAARDSTSIVVEPGTRDPARRDCATIGTCWHEHSRWREPRTVR